MVEIRKLITTRETIFFELGVTASRPVVRAVSMAVIRKRHADGFGFGNPLPCRESRPASS